MKNKRKYVLYIDKKEILFDVSKSKYRELIKSCNNREVYLDKDGKHFREYFNPFVPNAASPAQRINLNSEKNIKKYLAILDSELSSLKKKVSKASSIHYDRVLGEYFLKRKPTAKESRLIKQLFLECREEIENWTHCGDINEET